MGDTTNQFKARADQSVVKDDQNLIGQLDTAPQGIDEKAFSGLRDAEYKGPVTFGNAADLYKQATGNVNSAAGKAQASKTEGGRFALLDNYFGRPQYTQGQKTLDNLLVQNDPNSQQAFKQTQENAKALQENLSQTGKELGDYGAQAKAATDATRNQTRNALGIDNAGNATGGGVIGGLKNTINDRLTQSKTEADRISQAIAQGKFGEISPQMQEILSRIGLSYGVKAKDYLSNVDSSALNEASVTNSDESARMRTLARLAGMGDPYSANESDLGTHVGDDFYDFNEPGYGTKVGQQKSAFTQAKTSLEQQRDDVASNLQKIDQWLEEYGADPNYPGSLTYKPLGITGTIPQIKAEIQSRIAAINKQLQGLYGSYDVPYAAPDQGGGSGGGITGGLLR